jgi:hypothetical protein
MVFVFSLIRIAGLVGSPFSGHLGAERRSSSPR